MQIFTFCLYKIIKDIKYSKMSFKKIGMCQMGHPKLPSNGKNFPKWSKHFFFDVRIWKIFWWCWNWYKYTTLTCYNDAAKVVWEIRSYYWKAFKLYIFIIKALDRHKVNEIGSFTWHTEIFSTIRFVDLYLHKVILLKKFTFTKL